MAAPSIGRAPYLGPTRAPLPLALLARISRALALLEGFGIGLFLCSLVALACWQFFARNLRGLGVPNAPLWIDSVIRHAVFFIGFLGAAFATHVVKHLRVDAVSRLLPIRVRLSARILTTAFAAVVCVLLVKSGWTFHQDIVANESADLSQAHELIDAARGTIALPVGFALILFHFVVQILLDAAWIVTGEEPPAEWLAEAHGGEILPAGGKAEALETATVLSEEL